MPADEDHVQHILLRILGVLLIAVGFALIAQQVRSDATNPIRIAQTIVSDVTKNVRECERRHVRVHARPAKAAAAARAKRPPLPPSPPTPPAPPVPLILTL